MSLPFEPPLKKPTIKLMQDRLNYAREDKDTSTYKYLYINDVNALLKEREDLIKILNKIKERYIELSQKNKFPDNAGALAWAQYQDALESILDRFED